MHGYNAWCPCAGIHAWISMHGYPCKDIHACTVMHEYPSMDMNAWISMRRDIHAWMDIHAWISIHGHPCIDKPMHEYPRMDRHARRAKRRGMVPRGSTWRNARARGRNSEGFHRLLPAPSLLDGAAYRPFNFGTCDNDLLGRRHRP